MPEELFFSADHHFWHGKGREDRGILKHQRRTRPFTTIEEMNEVLIERWNGRVNRNDRIYHLGDFCFGTAKETIEILRRLNGQIHLVLGNHDRFASNPEAAKRFKSISQIKEIRYDAQRIVMCHYAMIVWNCSHHGAWQLFGHSHGSLSVSPHRLQMDVGVDAVPDLAPIHFTEIREIMSRRISTPVDHHGKRGGGY